MPVTLPLAVTVSAPVPELSATIPLLPPLTVVPAPVVTVRVVPVELECALMQAAAVPAVTLPLAVTVSAPVP